MKHVIVFAQDLLLMSVVLLMCGAGCAAPNAPVASAIVPIVMTPSAEGVEAYRQPGSDLSIWMDSPTEPTATLYWEVRNARIRDADTKHITMISPDDMRSYFSASSGTGAATANLTVHSTWRAVLFDLHVWGEVEKDTAQGPTVLQGTELVKSFCLRD